MTGRYALIVDETVVNVVLWDGVEPYEPEGTLFPVPANLPVEAGWIIDAGGDWVVPAPRVEPAPEGS